MPTENRSSNTENSTKLSPCPFCGQQDAFVEQLDSDASVVICQGRIDEYSACLARGPVGVQQHECEDQPGHDQAVKEWNRRAAAQHHTEPVAWMVGNAIWWGKAGAERDSAEVGLPVIALGPIADPGEVERLRAGLKWESERAALCLEELQDCEEQRDGLHDEVSSLRAQLAERDALLADIAKRHWSGVDFDMPADLVNRIKALSAGAEPSAQSSKTTEGNDNG